MIFESSLVVPGWMVCGSFSTNILWETGVVAALQALSYWIAELDIYISSQLPLLIWGFAADSWYP